MNKDIFPGKKQVLLDKKVAPTVCRFLRLKYVVLDTRYYYEDQLSDLKNYLMEVFSVDETYEKGFQLVLKTIFNPVPPRTIKIAGDNPARNIYFLQGWKKEAYPSEEETFLKANLNSELIFYLDSGNYYLEMDCRVSEGLADLDFFLDERKITSVIMDDKWQLTQIRSAFPVYEPGYYHLLIKIKPASKSYIQKDLQLWVRHLTFSAR